MPTALSLHIGVNEFDPSHYGNDGFLPLCENDANAMRELAENAGFEARQFLTRAATRDAVLAVISESAARLNSGDIFVMTNACHGGQIVDGNGDETIDGKDETICLFDAQLLDDEIYGAFAHFRAGVRILMVADSCNSASVARAAFGRRPVIATCDRADDSRAVRRISGQTARDTYNRNLEFYESVIENSRHVRDNAVVNCPVILLGGCEDGQSSFDGSGANGAFTEALLASYAEGPSGGYKAFRNAIAGRLPTSGEYRQIPSLFRTGTTSISFEAQSPFTI